jgi:hypothetical protein
MASVQFLRRHDPDQVLRVTGMRLSLSPALRAPRAVKSKRKFTLFRYRLVYTSR